MTDDPEFSGPFARSLSKARGVVSLFGHARGEVIDPAPNSLQPLREVLAPRHDPERLTLDLPQVRIDPELARENHLIIAHADDPVGRLFDLLRTQLLQALQERGWNRVAITAPTRGCGASFVALNLAFSLARRHSGRAVLVDLDLRAPCIAGRLGLGAPGEIRDLLTGDAPMESLFCRHGEGLVLGLNDRAELDAAELLQSPATAQALEAMIDDLSPDVVLYDLPPVLESDDVLAFLPEVDGVLLVSDGSQTSAEDIRECERLFKDRTTLIGVVLNRAEDRPGKTKKR